MENTDKPMTKTAKNPSGHEIVFNEENHTYQVNGHGLISATTFIDQFFPEFDSQEVSKTYAEKNGLNQSDVLAQWKQKGDDASDLGHIVHLYAEKLFKEEDLPITDDPKVQKYFNVVNKTVVKLLKRFDFIDAEMIVFSEELGVAGTIDLLMKDRANDDIVIFDWKTNEEIKKENPWQNAFLPIQHLQNCKWNRHQLQLNLYWRILFEENYLPFNTNYRMALIHLSEDGVGWHKVGNMSREVAGMLGFDRDIPF